VKPWRKNSVNRQELQALGGKEGTRGGGQEGVSLPGEKGEDFRGRPQKILLEGEPLFFKGGKKSGAGTGKRCLFPSSAEKVGII